MLCDEPMPPRIPPAPLNWSPILNVGFLTVPICAGLLGGWFQLPLIAVALCLPQAGFLSWFYRQRGAVLVSLLALAAWWIPYVTGTQPGRDFVEHDALIGPLVIFVFSHFNVQFRRTLEHARALADTDSLTGLLNKQGFERRLVAEANRSARSQTSLAIAFLDVDNFKRLNDNHGHMVGDQLLIQSAHLFQSYIRNYDAAARMGGDEFTLLFPATDVEAAKVVLDRIADQLQRLSRTRGWDVSWSIGAIVVSEPANSEAMIRAADELMYEVKESGKGQIRIREWSPKPELVTVS